MFKRLLLKSESLLSFWGNVWYFCLARCQSPLLWKIPYKVTPLRNTKFQNLAKKVILWAGWTGWTGRTEGFSIIHIYLILTFSWLYNAPQAYILSISLLLMIHSWYHHFSRSEGNVHGFILNAFWWQDLFGKEKWRGRHFLTTKMKNSFCRAYAPVNFAPP